MNKTYFITGIGTEVGKTMVSAIVTEALEADYFKPVQAGDLDYSDTHKVKAMLSNSKSKFFDNAYALQTPMSPHAAAEIDQVEIQLKDIQRPETENTLVIEGAGGLLVPLNSQDCIIDLIEKTDKIILVSRHYLGSINHTLLSIEALKSRGFSNIGIIFSGDEHPTTERIILEKTNLTCVGRIEEETEFSKDVVSKYAQKLKLNLEKL
ncbi:dethiobiotin synthase [Psychroflexus sp. YR1-1]|uniref:ATP-dependent dethiobiotin synthetase BioD n=1 Tax=Psychroflexus aurantiacus TaxID=2709310 RepID=A0A6B3R0T8_9FLAO|nr:dethiobiotin synthase [Psychroflexus aurantiacus]NEV92597.1 dethiobiotin synthase [Psychroflexus aurantiacus]